MAAAVEQRKARPATASRTMPTRAMLQNPFMSFLLLLQHWLAAQARSRFACSNSCLLISSRAYRVLRTSSGVGRADYSVRSVGGQPPPILEVCGRFSPIESRQGDEAICAKAPPFDVSLKDGQEDREAGKMSHASSPLSSRQSPASVSSEAW
jgi:hypothetical protein